MYAVLTNYASHLHTLLSNIISERDENKYLTLEAQFTVSQLLYFNSRSLISQQSFQREIDCFCTYRVSLLIVWYICLWVFLQVCAEPSQAVMSFLTLDYGVIVEISKIIIHEKPLLMHHIIL